MSPGRPTFLARVRWSFARLIYGFSSFLNLSLSFTLSRFLKSYIRRFCLIDSTFSCSHFLLVVLLQTLQTECLPSFPVCSDKILLAVFLFTSTTYFCHRNSHAPTVKEYPSFFLAHDSNTAAIFCANNRLYKLAVGAVIPNEIATSRCFISSKYTNRKT